MPQVFFSPHTFPMASVIMDDRQKALLCHVFHKWKISFFVFGHAMDQLQDSFVRVCIRNQSKYRDLQPVCLGIKASFIFFAHVLPLSAPCVDINYYKGAALPLSTDSGIMGAVGIQ